MRLPFLRTAPQEQRKQIGQFLGLNKSLIINENEFADMQNMSSDRFPAICTRRPRGAVMKTLGKPHGLFHKNGLAYVDGTKLYYKDQAVADVTDTDKIMVGIGAYIVIWPDKIMYNTADGTVTPLEVTWTQSATATFSLTTAGSTMVKISSTGIGKAFQRYDAVTISGCTNAAFNRTTVIQEKEDNYIVVIGDLSATFTQASGLTLKRTVPDMDYVCESENRLWGCSSANHEIYASKLGDPTNWQAFEGISTDSYAVTVGSDGDFTGCISHLGYVLFFKGDTIHKVFGSKPSNYQVTTSTPMRGVAKGCERTICIVNETLLYVSRDDVCSFDGAQPESIGVAVKSLGFDTGVASHYNGKYYASLRDSAGSWGLYVYDLGKGLWHKEDSLHALYMAYGEGELYCIDEHGNLFTITGDRQETIPWSIESGDLIEGSVEYKHVKRLMYNMIIAPGAEVNAYIRYDDDPDWKKINTFTGKSYRTHIMTVVPGRCQRYRIRLDGIGDVTLIALGKVIGQGSELHGTL